MHRGERRTITGHGGGRGSGAKREKDGGGNVPARTGWGGRASEEDDKKRQASTGIAVWCTAWYDLFTISVKMRRSKYTCPEKEQQEREGSTASPSRAQRANKARRPGEEALSSVLKRRPFLCSESASVSPVERQPCCSTAPAQLGRISWCSALVHGAPVSLTDASRLWDYDTVEAIGHSARIQASPSCRAEKYARPQQHSHREQIESAFTCARRRGLQDPQPL